MDIASEKKAVRALARAAAGALSPQRRAEQSAAACKRITELAEYARAQTLLAYMATNAECDPHALVAVARAAGKRVAFPLCVSATELALYVPLQADSFEWGAFGIMEPVPARCERIAPEEIDVAIVPGVAFDSQRQRLGHGAGYYDRLLCGMRAATVGLAFNEQIVDRIPCEATDIAMDYVITEKWTYCK